MEHTLRNEPDPERVVLETGNRTQESERSPPPKKCISDYLFPISPVLLTRFSIILAEIIVPIAGLSGHQDELI